MRGGRPSFSDLQNLDRAPVYYAFDLPTLSGDDLMKRTLDQRRKALRKLIRRLVDPIRFSETFDTSPSEMIAIVREQGLEGIVAKRLDSFYEPGKRSGAWVKLRVNRRQNFIVGGYMPRGASFDSILVGYYEGHEIKYATSVRAGFTPASRREVFARCSKLEAPECPFSNLPDATKGRWGAGMTALRRTCGFQPVTNWFHFLGFFACRAHFKPEFRWVPGSQTGLWLAEPTRSRFPIRPKSRWRVQFVTLARAARLKGSG
jgi:hypothetical protein